MLHPRHSTHIRSFGQECKEGDVQEIITNLKTLACKFEEVDFDSEFLAGLDQLTCLNVSAASRFKSVGETGCFKALAKLTRLDLSANCLQKLDILFD